MAEFDPAGAIGLLETSKASLWPDQSTRDEFLAEARARLGGRSADDRKEATKLAVETAKTLLTVAVALLVTVGTLLQFARTNGVPWLSGTVALFGLSVVLLFVSMQAGFSAISDVFKRADGLVAANEPAWSTAPLSKRLNKQSGSGILALVALIAGLVVWAWSGQSQVAAVSVTISTQNTTSQPNSPLIIDRKWDVLRLKTAGNQEITMDQKSAPVSATCR
jgi:hypothetical protein